MWSLRCGLRQSLGRVMTRAMSASVPQIAPAPIMSANHVKRLNRKKLASALDPAAKTWFVDAYCTAEAYDLNGLHRLIRREGLYDSFEMFEDGCDALRITPRYLVDDERREIFFLCGGSVVFWNVTELERLTILRKLRDFEKGRYPENFVFDEAEKMSYSHSEVAKAFLQKNQIILANESSPKHLDKYTFSHALALSVKLGILEATLDEFVEKIEHVHEDLRKEGLIRLSRTEVLKKLGALFALRHSVNLSSEFLDETPDFYWDRENLEPLYQHMKDYLNIGKRAKVMNEKLSLCCDLMDILVTHLNDTHHVRLEWMIIILIVIEVVCEFIHLMPLNMNDDFDSDTGDDDLFSDDINHDVPFHHAGTLMELNDNKAGMADLDKEKISRIIEEASKGSKFYDHKKKQQERIDAKIADLLRKKKAITEEQLKNASAKVGQIVRNLEKSRDLSRTFVHVDMDAFYAAVEMRDDPSLRDKPMAVGGPGMLATSNYLARRFGVRAAMPGFIGQKLCPDLIIVPPNFEKYRAVNAIFSEVFAKYDPNYSAMSLDEAYLDITEFLRLDQNVRKPSDLSHAEEVVSDLREEIFLATQLTASAGIAPNTLLAKVCSDINKPNGQFYLRPERPVVAEFVEKLSVRKACGIGKVTEQMLNALGITTCAEMFEQRALLSLLFSEISALSFLRVSMGLGSTFMGDSDAPAKSVSNERTFKATSDADFLRDQCRRLCEELSEDLVRKQLQAKSVTIKLKTDTFDVKTRVRNLPEATWNADVLCRHVVPMLESEMAPKRAFRLMGVRASNLCEKSANQQSTLDAILKQPSGTERLCPVCSTSLAKLSLALVNAHLDRCLSGSQQDDVQCPICSGFFRRPEIEHHAATCEGAATSTTPSVKSAPIRKRGAAREDGFVPRDECQRKPKKQLTLSAFFDQRKSES